MRADPAIASAAHGEAGRIRRSAFGLPLELDARLALPGLRPRAADAPARRPTRVRIDPDGVRRGWEAAGPVVRTRELRVGETLLLAVDACERTGYLLSAPGRGRVLVSRDGLDVRCAPEPGATDWAALIPAQVLPLAATLRGLEVLHAAGIRLGARVVLLAGEPGAGKTSLAAALVLAGGALLSDDAVALERNDGSVVAHPGSGVLQLRAPEWERLGADARRALRPLPARPDAGAKRRCAPRMATGPAPVGALCLLERADSDAPPALERIARVDPFALLATTFNLSVRTPARLSRHLDLCAALADGVPIHRLRVQPGVDATALAAIVARQLEAA
jgi:hypothetical protein